MEMLAAAGSMAMSAAGSAASAVSGALGIGGTAAGAGATAAGLGGLSQGFSAFSALAKMGGGLLSGVQALGSAEGQRFQGKVDMLAGEEAVADLARRRNETIANNMVIAAASGLDITSGEPVDMANSVTADADKQIFQTRTNAATRAYLRKSMARSQEIGAVSSVVEGFAGAAKELSSSSMATARRGVPA
jgi:hypothetical protein